MLAKLFKRSVFLLIFLPCVAFGLSPDEIISDPILEERARALSKGIRCPVCLSESIDESNAQLSRDLRLLLRARLVAGDTDAEALAFLVARYGEFILLSPRFSGINVILWAIGPALFLGVAGGLAVFAYRKRRNTPRLSEATLSPEDEATLKMLERPTSDDNAP